MKSAVVNGLKRVRSTVNWWMHQQTMEHLENIRAYELEAALAVMPAGGRLLEIGAGTGGQSKRLSERGYDVKAVDIASSVYKEHRVWPVLEYDGRHLPFEDASFDIVFSSNTLEHVAHLREFQVEIHRVLAPGGLAVHVLPTGSWRFWTSLACCLRVWSIPEVHGEYAGNAISEMYYFGATWWTNFFRSSGWQIVTSTSNGLFYTGHSVMDARLSMKARHRLSRVLG